eukprot:gb/GEZN01010146.1/.p1 GENE.gb/GEZN01010146.1/~~gb/GEZN01010146.1/.p1  ORF type:complete len:319 (-),score=49.25 gb/GEZN01010146.1/:273-1229(-)
MQPRPLIASTVGNAKTTIVSRCKAYSMRCYSSDATKSGPRRRESFSSAPLMFSPSRSSSPCFSSASTSSSSSPASTSSPSSTALDWSSTYTSTPLSPPAKAFLAGGSSVLALMNPFRADMIAALGEVTADPWALSHMHASMSKNEEGRLILSLKPRISDRAIKEWGLHQRPEGSFGRAYASFLASHQYRPDQRTPVKYVKDIEQAYVMQRYREVHDLLHVLTGLSTRVYGELVLKWLELLQTGMPMCGIGAFVGPLRLSLADKALLATQGIPWALRCHLSLTQPLMSVHFERYWDEPLTDMRARLGIVPWDGDQGDAL